MRRARANNRGAVLIEAIVALAVLGAVGGSAAWAVSESLRTAAVAWQHEDELRAAGRFMTAVSLWPRQDLDRHLGTSRQGEWRLSVERNAPGLYAVTLADSTGARPLLITMLRRDP
jgi:type II secretory pathway pseudopilin PulG